MPYTLEDPNELRPLPQIEPEAQAIVDEMEQDHEADVLEKELAELRPVILSARDRENRAAAEAVASHPGVEALRGAGREVAAVWKKFDSALPRTQADANLSPQGRNDARKALEETRDREIDAIAENIMSREGDSVLRAFPSSSALTSPSSDKITAQVSLILRRFPHILPHDFSGEAIATLRRANDPQVSVVERDRADQVLALAYKSLVMRRAVSPERHARPLAGLNRELAGLIQAHLETRLQAARHKLAVHVVAQARAEFGFLVNSLRQNGSWDSNFQVGAPSFKW